VLSHSPLGFLRVLRAFKQVSRFGLRAILAATVLMAAPKAGGSDARLFQVAQGASRPGFPVFRQADAGHQFLLETASWLSRFYSSLQSDCSRCNRLTLLRFSDKADDARSGHAIFLGDIRQRHPGEAVADQRIVVDVERRSSEALAF
jgi:hypothetical protein